MLDLFFSLVVFAFGLIVGSFLNCVIYRLEKEESFLKGRSYCPYCKHGLSWKDLVPLLSFLILKGKCRYCQKQISWQYPLVEISTALLFLSIFNFQFFLLRQGFGGQAIFNFIYYLIISSFLIIIFVYDLKHYIIPDGVVYSAIIVALIFNLQFSISNEFSIFKLTILSAFGAAAFFLLIVLISRGRWMGVGDIKLAALMGLFLGWPNILVALFLAFFIGAVIGTGLIMSGKKTLKSEVPFGPFLITGTFLALFFGQDFLNWYLNLFLLK